MYNENDVKAIIETAKEMLIELGVDKEYFESNFEPILHLSSEWGKFSTTIEAFTALFGLEDTTGIISNATSPNETLSTFFSGFFAGSAYGENEPVSYHFPSEAQVSNQPLAYTIS